MTFRETLLEAVSDNLQKRQLALNVLKLALEKNNWNINQHVQLYADHPPISPLSLVIAEKAKPLFTLLTQNNVEVNYFDCDGGTPLTLALKAHGAQDADWFIQHLIKAGAIFDMTKEATDSMLVTQTEKDAALFRAVFTGEPKK